MKKVLIIDDEPDTILFLSTWLEDHGYETFSATDGEHGMEMLRAVRPDLVLMDLKMPRQTGMQLYREIHQLDDFHDLPVIFITGVTDYHLFTRDCATLPAPAACIAKPIDLAALQQAIEEALR